MNKRIHLDDIRERKASILVCAVESILGTCHSYDFETMIESGVMQVFGTYETPPNLEEILEELTELELTLAMESADVDECADCGWWCDDLHYTNDNVDGDVCRDCSEEE